VWSVNWGLTTNQNVNALLRDSWAVNRSDLPVFVGNKDSH